MPSDGDAFTLADPPGWRIGTCLSRRNGTCVHRAEHADGRSALLKRLEGGAPDPIARLRFEREARLGRLLQHPGLAAPLASGEDWLLTEWLEPGLVEKRRHFSSLRQLAPLLAELTQTFGYLHGRGIVHQDVKPAHILFRGDRVVLVDFGVAGLVAEDPLAGREAVGAPAWAASEQLAGAPPAPAADIWSLGRIALWLLGEAGLERVPAPLGPLLRRCLDAEPARRPSAADLLEQLRTGSRFAADPSAL